MAVYVCEYCHRQDKMHYCPFPTKLSIYELCACLCWQEGAKTLHKPVFLYIGNHGGCKMWSEIIRYILNVITFIVILTFLCIYRFIIVQDLSGSAYKLVPGFIYGSRFICIILFNFMILSHNGSGAYPGNTGHEPTLDWNLVHHRASITYICT